MLNAGDFLPAYSLLDGLNYKDSEEQIAKLHQIFFSQGFLNAEVGSTVSLGSLEWIVLKKQSNRVLVISKYAVGFQPYNTPSASVTWETCSLRKWLNGTFFDETFSEFEQFLIPTVTVKADANPTYDVDQGNDTQDKIFLLSVSEVDTYFPSTGERKLYSEDGQGSYRWWLRTSGSGTNRATSVYAGGGIDKSGTNVGTTDIAVRPALWIDLSILNPES